MKILAVDDSPSMLEILVSTIGEAGHRVLEAGTGAEAMKVLATDFLREVNFRAKRDPPQSTIV